MGISLTGLTPATTYDALIKVGDNGPINGTLKVLSDGLGTNLPMQVSTTGVNFTGTVTGIPSTPPSGVAGAIQFSDGSAFSSDATKFFWDNTNKRLGIGTNAPTQVLDIVSTQIGQLRLYNSSNAVRFTLDGSAYGNIVNNSGQLYIDTNGASTKVVLRGADGTEIQKGATIKGSGSTSATTALLVQNSAGTTAFSIKDNGVTNATYIEGGTCWFNNVNSNGIVKFGSSMSVGFNSDPSATAHIKGSGSTSATTSLLVQNSGGTESLKVQDDNIVRTTYLGIGGGTSTNNIGGTHIAQFGNAVSSGDQIIVVDSVNGSKRGFKFGNQGSIRMALIQNDANLQIGNYANPSAFVPYTTFDYLTGNVGIGTTTPNTNLEVYSGAGGYISHNASSGYNGFSGFRCLVQGGIRGYMELNPNTGEFKVGADGSGYFLTLGAGGVERMRVTPTGTIVKGSGTTSATTALLVQNNSGIASLRVTDDGYVSLNKISSLDGTGIVRTPIFLQSEGSGFVFKNSGSADLLNITASNANFLGTISFNNSSPSASACLDLTSTTKGLLPPRMTTTQKNAISTPASGLVVYDTTTNKLCCYNGSSWNDLF